jgi:aspartate aminotransferase
MKIAKRIRDIEESLTLALTAKAKQMKKDGIDVVGFGAGEPDFDTPDHIKQVAIDDIKKGVTKYTPASGTLELRQAVCEKFKKDNGLDYKPNQVLISCGAKHSVFNAIVTICDDGDEVIIPAPYWLTYPEQVKAAGGKSVIVETSIENEFKMTAAQLRKAITKRTVAVIINSPSNPTGSVYSRKELEALGKLIAEKKIAVISDEIYEKLLYDGAEHYSIAALSPELKDLTIVVNGASKSYSMTGWRIGYAAGPFEVIDAMAKFQSHSTSNPTSFCQNATIAAIRGDQSCVEKMRTAFDERRKYMVERLNAMKGVKCTTPKGAFYVFPDVSATYGRQICGKKVTGSMSFAEVLLDGAKVSVVPGISFGDDKCVRLSYATSMENIKKGLDRMEEALSA